MDDFTTGTTLVALETVKMKLSHRDLLLLLGILVALIIGLTTLVYQESTNYGRQTSTPAKSGLNSSPAVMVKKLIEKVDIRSVLDR